MKISDCKLNCLNMEKRRSGRTKNYFCNSQNLKKGRRIDRLKECPDE